MSEWTVLPPGSHLRLKDDDEEGVEVVALRSSTSSWPEHGEVMTCRGDVLRLDKDTRLQVGDFERRSHARR
jgi:hypothetical protein